MEQKIIRISKPLHAEYKELVAKFPNLTLSTATELLIQNALKRGEIERSEKTAYNAVKELDTTFRKWMRQQEKTHLTRISEELLALAHELRDTTTQKDLQKQSERIGKAFEITYEHLEKTKLELMQSLAKLSSIVDDKLSKKIF